MAPRRGAKIAKKTSPRKREKCEKRHGRIVSSEPTKTLKSSKKEELHHMY